MEELGLSANATEAITNNSSKFMKYKIAGGTKYGYATEIGTTGYMVLTALSFSEYYAKLAMCAVILEAIFVIGIIIIVLGIKNAARKITEPIAVLNTAAQQLAEQSSKAANTTRELIGISMQEIEHGNSIAENVVASLEDAVSAVEKVNKMIRKTSDNASNQADHMKQINEGIDEISKSISDNSAVAEESSATSQELAAQAAVLNQLLEKFEF